MVRKYDAPNLAQFLTLCFRLLAVMSGIRRAVGDGPVREAFSQAPGFIPEEAQIPQF